jgi:hypothetical protein
LLKNDEFEKLLKGEHRWCAFTNVIRGWC